MDPARPEVAGLEALLMNPGSIADLQIDPATWTVLADSLKAYFPSDNTGAYDHICTAYYAHDHEKPSVSGSQDCPANLVASTVKFVEIFMQANGQWAYIVDQDWYTSGDYVIAVEINFYPQRWTPAYTLSPLFHKDTPGDNLFVNLIFDNKGPIAATEWFVDAQEPSSKRAEWQKLLLPPDHLLELTKFRQKLEAHPHESQLEVQGGVVSYENAYVSWLDDLVWHATPSTSKRIVYSTALAKAAYDQVNTIINLKSLYEDKTLKIEIDLVELLGTIAEERNTDLYRWLAVRRKKVQDLDLELAREAWLAVYPNRHPSFDKDVEARGSKPWRMVGEVAQATVQKDRLGQLGSKEIGETAVGLSTIRRVNSKDKSGLLAKVVADNQDVPRTFLRTWVRIVRKDLPEVGGLVHEGI